MGTYSTNNVGQYSYNTTAFQPADPMDDKVIGITDAPYDGLLYGRKDGEWVEFFYDGGRIEAIIYEDAPYTGLYGRQQGNWVEFFYDGGRIT